MFKKKGIKERKNPQNKNVERFIAFFPRKKKLDMQNIKAVNENLRAAFSGNGERKNNNLCEVEAFKFLLLEMTFDEITQQIIESFRWINVI